MAQPRSARYVHGKPALERDRTMTPDDLHALLPDTAYRDAAGHLGSEQLPEAPVRVAEAVAARLRDRQNWK